MTTGMDTRVKALLAAGFAASGLALSGLFGAYRAWDGQTTIDRLVVIFLFPTTATAVSWLLGSLLTRPVEAGGNGEAAAAARGIIFWIVTFLTGIHAIMLAVMTGHEPAWPWAQRGVIVLLGIALVAIGNLLPRTRPNLALGIRTARTLADRQLWILTHRLTGYLTVVAGIATLIAGLFVSGTQVAAVPLLSLVAGAAIVGTYYWRLARA